MLVGNPRGNVGWESSRQCWLGILEAMLVGNPRGNVGWESSRLCWLGILEAMLVGNPRGSVPIDWCRNQNMYPKRVS